MASLCFRHYEVIKNKNKLLFINLFMDRIFIYEKVFKIFFFLNMEWIGNLYNAWPRFALNRFLLKERKVLLVVEIHKVGAKYPEFLKDLNYLTHTHTLIQ